MSKQRAMEKKKFSLKTKANGSPCLSSREGAWFMSLRTPSYVVTAPFHSQGRRRGEGGREEALTFPTLCHLFCVSQGQVQGCTVPCFSRDIGSSRALVAGDFPTVRLLSQRHYSLSSVRVWTAQ